MGLMGTFCDMGSVPVVLRSDNAAEFVGSVVKHLGRLLGVKHIPGTAYHPQSQGAVESMHRTLNQYVHGIVEGNPEEWESALPFAQMILQSAPMACLGGLPRSGCRAGQSSCNSRSRPAR